MPIQPVHILKLDTSILHGFYQLPKGFSVPPIANQHIQKAAQGNALHKHGVTGVKCQLYRLVLYLRPSRDLSAPEKVHQSTCHVGILLRSKQEEIRVAMELNEDGAYDVTWQSGKFFGT